MGGWRQSLTSNSQPEMLASISRKKGLVLFLNHRKNCCSLKELYHDKPIRSPDDTVVLFWYFFEGPLMRDKSFHTMHNVITSLTKKQHCRKTRNKTYIKTDHSEFEDSFFHGFA